MELSFWYDSNDATNSGTVWTAGGSHTHSTVNATDTYERSKQTKFRIKRPEIPKCRFCGKKLTNRYKVLKAKPLKVRYACNDCEYVHSVIHKEVIEGRQKSVREIFYFVLDYSGKDSEMKVKNQKGGV